MGTSPEALRRNIEQIRGDLGATVDAIEEKVSPKAALQRRGDKMRDGLGRIRGATMGVPSSLAARSGASGGPSALGQAGGSIGQMGAQVGDQVTDRVQAAAEGLRGVPGQVKHRTEGSPLAMGLLAFGAGLLASSLLPASEVEQRAAEQLRDQAEPITDALTESAQQLKQHVTEQAQQATQDLKDTASGAVSEVKQAATDHAQQLSHEAQATAQQAAADAKTSASQPSSPLGGDSAATRQLPTSG